MNLVIVESPTKGTTIEKFLGKKYKVTSSYGHIRDLPEKQLGVDIKHDFEPKYVIPLRVKKRIQELKNYLEKSQIVILATDEDREGEAIAYHLTKILNLNGQKPYQRIVFHEITKKAIEQALKSPRKIDMNLVNAQQTRRILDRLVGYKLSPFLWKKVVRGLSAGRVQSVVVKLIAEREKEIENFKPIEYWSIETLLQKRGTDKKQEIKALLVKKDNKPISKLGIKNKEEADKIVKDLEKAEYKVINIEKKEIKKNPLPPFTTSTLQQEAGNKLRFSAKKTMFLAQNLYERGAISYHRTDSLNLSEFSLLAAKKFITGTFGKEYWAGSLRKFKTKSKAAQEAHEAIRPTKPERTPDDLKLDDNLFRVYDLIWRRFIACQMAQAIFDSSTVDISTQNYTFRANGQTLKFDGFLKVYLMKFNENELPSLEKNEILNLKKLLPSQHFTQPPPRYSEATLIKILEKEGIGRPSTYAPILDTIQRRNYVRKNENRKFQPTEIGVLVNDLLVEHFPKIVDLKFTANMEEDLDKVARGKKDWIKTLRDFYEPFEKNLEKKQEEIPKKKLIEETDKKCPKCGANIIIRLGKYGKFYACSNFPKCKYTESLKKPSLEIKCPRCKKGEIVEKRTKKGKIFYGCSNFPECDFALWDKPFTKLVQGKPVAETCPKCGSLLVEKGKKIKCSNKECDS